MLRRAARQLRTHVVACVALFFALGGTAGAAESSVEEATFKHCHDQANFLTVPMERIEDRVPEDYTVNPNGGPGPTGVTAEVAVSEVRCEEASVDAEALPGPVSIAFANVPLSSPPEGSRDVSGAGNVYSLFVSTDSKPLANWLKAGNGQAYYVPGIVHDYTIPEEEFGVNAFSFKAPTPPEWAFEVRGVASVQRNLAEPIPNIRVWHDTKMPDGKTRRVEVTQTEHPNSLAPAEVTIQAAAGSEMEEIIVSNPPVPSVAVPSVAVSGLIPRFEFADRTKTIVRP